MTQEKYSDLNLQSQKKNVVIFKPLPPEVNIGQAYSLSARTQAATLRLGGGGGGGGGKLLFLEKRSQI